VFWIRNTIRKVTIVVPVLMISCHVSEKWKKGPLSAHTTTTTTQKAKVVGRPVAWATFDEKSVKAFANDTGRLLLKNVIGRMPVRY
jgi:hypothetical protein